jgi:hypothetical protein
MDSSHLLKEQKQSQDTIAGAEISIGERTWQPNDLNRRRLDSAGRIVASWQHGVSGDSTALFTQMISGAAQTSSSRKNEEQQEEEHRDSEDVDRAEGKVARAGSPA